MRIIPCYLTARRGQEWRLNLNKKIGILSMFFVAMFVSSLFVSVGVMTLPQAPQNQENQGSSLAGYPAVDLDKRNSPVSILVYTQFADTTSAAPYNEFRNTMDSIEATYGEQLRYDNLTLLACMSSLGVLLSYFANTSAEEEDS